jgi:hypothetical protein
MAESDEHRHGYDDSEPRRRAGLRSDERDPNEPAGPPGSAGGGTNMSGTPGGGMAEGGLEGTNRGDGSPEDVNLEDAFGAGIYDDLGNQPEDEGGPPYAGPSGGAVGGTPAEKRAEGGSTHGGIAPGTADHVDRMLGPSRQEDREMKEESCG